VCVYRWLHAGREGQQALSPRPKDMLIGRGLFSIVHSLIVMTALTMSVGMRTFTF